MFLVLLTIISLTSIVLRAYGRLPLTVGRMDVISVVMPLNVLNRHSFIQYYLNGIRDINTWRASRLF